MKYYLIGKNIQTSFSPQIHNFLFKIKNRKSNYQQPISGKIINIREMENQSFGGMSITIPYKTLYRDQHKIQKLGDLSKKYGLLNTIFKDRYNKLIGTNTDIFGISQCFLNKLQIQHRNSLIIGAGATAEIFCSFFEANKIKTSFINRSQSKEQIKQRFTNVVDFLPLKPQPHDFKGALTYQIIVNTLPSQVVYQNWDHIELNLKNLLNIYSKKTKIKIIYMNVNYRHQLDPIQQLLKRKLSLYVETLKGIDMLLWQALEQNRYFCQEQSFHSEEYLWQFNKVQKQLNLI